MPNAGFVMKDKFQQLAAYNRWPTPGCMPPRLIYRIRHIGFTSAFSSVICTAHLIICS